MGGAKSSYDALVNKARNPQGERKHVRKPQALNPVAKRVVVIHKEDQSHRGHLVAGRWGKRWEYMDGEHDRVPYDTELIPLLTTRGLPRLIDHIMPTLNPERKRRLMETMQSIIHAKQRKHEKETEPALDQGTGSRRYTKREKRTLYELRKRLRIPKL